MLCIAAEANLKEKDERQAKVDQPVRLIIQIKMRRLGIPWTTRKRTIPIMNKQIPAAIDSLKINVREKAEQPGFISATIYPECMLSA